MRRGFSVSGRRRRQPSWRQSRCANTPGRGGRLRTVGRLEPFHFKLRASLAPASARSGRVPAASCRRLRSTRRRRRRGQPGRPGAARHRAFRRLPAAGGAWWPVLRSEAAGIADGPPKPVGHTKFPSLRPTVDRPHLASCILGESPGRSGGRRLYGRLRPLLWAGRSTLQRAKACGQRGWKWHPGGGASGEGSRRIGT